MATRKFTQRSRIREGRPNPLGATWDGLGSTSRCTRATPPAWSCACSMSAAASRSAWRCPNTPTRSGTAICPTRPGQLYGYRVHGPYAPDAGHRFNHNKLLLDPYAKQIVGELKWAPHLFGYTIGHRDKDLSLIAATAPPSCPNPR